MTNETTFHLIRCTYGGVYIMTKQEFRPVNAKEKSGIDNLQSCCKEIQKLKTQVNPKDYQCIAIDEFIIFPGTYHPQGIVEYKTPRKRVDYEIGKFPEGLQEEVQKLQIEHNLTKKQIKELQKTVKYFNIQIDNIEKKLELLRNKAFQIKDQENTQKQINNFFKFYKKFSECLTNDLASYEPETKNEIREALTKLIHLIEDVIEKYLS